jgi:RNA polymerase sigma factor (sigma-70 family)
MELLPEVEHEHLLSDDHESQPEARHQPVDTRLIEGYARDLAAAPLLDREVEAGHALALQEARETLAALVLKLPAGLRGSVLGAGTPGPEAGRKWPLRHLDACCDALALRAAEDPDAERVSGELRHHKRRLDRARDALIVGNLRLVVHLAKAYHSYNISFMDLVQEGNLGLIEAVDRFECERGHRFGTYAAWWIRRSILLAFAEKSGVIRTSRYMRKRVQELKAAARELSDILGRRPTTHELAGRMQIPVSKIVELMTLAKDPCPLESVGPDGEPAGVLKSVPDDSAVSPLVGMLTKERRERILAAMELLEPRERAVLFLRFGIGGESRKTLKEIGKILRVSRERVRQIERLAIARLLHDPRTRGLVR